MKYKIETAEEFIKRKEIEFKKDKIIKTKDIGRKGKVIWVREAWTFMPQSNIDNKVFIIERFRKEDFEGKLANQNAYRKGAIEYRFGYYIVGKIGRATDKWVWGQFCPLIPAGDLILLLEKAKKEKVII